MKATAICSGVRFRDQILFNNLSRHMLCVKDFPDLVISLLPNGYVRLELDGAQTMLVSPSSVISLVLESVVE
jgi:hypothetical protein